MEKGPTGRGVAPIELDTHGLEGSENASPIGLAEERSIERLREHKRDHVPL